MAKSENKQVQIIQDYLDKFAQQDQVFAEKYKDPSHSMDGCMEYIRSQARKQAVGGCAMIEDSVVFGWATHYFDEPVNKPAPAKNDGIKAQTIIEAKKAPTTAQKETAKPEEKKQYVQLSLFN